MNKIFIYARACVNKMTCSAVFFVPCPKYPKIDGNDKTFLDFFWNLASFYPFKEIAKAVTCFASNRAWMIRWNLKVCRKDWHLLGKRPQIGLCRKISNLYKVSSVFNVCFISTKQVNYKVSSTAKNYTLLLSPNNPTEAGKFLLQ